MNYSGRGYCGVVCCIIHTSGLFLFSGVSVLWPNMRSIAINNKRKSSPVHSLFVVSDKSSMVKMIRTPTSLVCSYVASLGIK